ncbi:MAG: repeat-containing protein YrrB [Verrucomicrobiota bacterium]
MPAAAPRKFLFPLVLAGAVVAAWANSFSGPFVFDDASSIVANPTIRSLWPPWAALTPPNASVTVQGRPVLNFSFALNYAMSGTAVWSYHALNLAIHVAAALTLFGVVRRTLLIWARPAVGRVSDPAPSAARGEGQGTALPDYLAFAIALLWALHPLHTESVTYIVQRAESLMGLFFLLTFFGFARGVDSARRGAWFAFAVVACALGAATKEVMVAAPPLVLLCDRTFVSGSFAAAWRRHRWLHVGLFATWIELAWLVLGAGGNRGGSFDAARGMWAYPLTQFEALTRYVWLALWPRPLVFEYGAFWTKGAADVLPWALPVVALLGATLWALRRQPAVGFLGAWFFAILAPTSLMPGTTQMIVEHRMYLPLVAVVVAVVLAMRAWVKTNLVLRLFQRTEGSLLGSPEGAKVDSPGQRPGIRIEKCPRPEGATPASGFALSGLGFFRRTFPRALPWAFDFSPRWGSQSLAATHREQRGTTTFALVAAVVVAGAALGAATFARNRDYRSEIALWADTVAKRPANPLAHQLLGMALVEAGDGTAARAHFERALALKPDFALAHDCHGQLLWRAGEPAAAAAAFARAVELQPGFADARDHLAKALVALRRPAEAAAHFAEALRLKPDFPGAAENLGNLLLDAGRPAEAVPQFAAAVRLAPLVATTHYNLANALAIAGRPREALPHYAEALRLEPAFVAAHSNFGGALLEVGRFEEGTAHLEAALRLDPNFAEAREMLARVRALRP